MILFFTGDLVDLNSWGSFLDDFDPLRDVLDAFNPLGML